jgi:hypothetical protein
MDHEKGTGTACCFDVAESCSFTNQPHRSSNYALHKTHRVKPCKATSSSTKSLPFSHQEVSKIYVSLIDCHPQSCHLHFLLTRKLVLRAPYDVTLYHPIPVRDPSFLRQPWKAPSKLNPPFPNVTTVGLHRKARLYRRQRDRQIQCNPPSPIFCSTPKQPTPTDRPPSIADDPPL